MKLVFGAFVWGRGGFSLPKSGRPAFAEAASRRQAEVAPTHKEKVEPHGLKPVAPPHASSGLPSPKRLRASRRNPPKHTLLRSFGASKGTLPAFIHGLKTRGFLRRRAKCSFIKIFQNTPQLCWGDEWPTLSPGRLCRNEGDAMFVILNEVKNLIESIS